LTTALSEACFELSGCAPAVALTHVEGTQMASLIHVAAGETMPAAQALSRSMRVIVKGGLRPR